MSGSRLLIPQMGPPIIKAIQIPSTAVAPNNYMDMSIPGFEDGSIVVVCDVFCVVSPFTLYYISVGGDVGVNGIPFPNSGAFYSVQLRGVRALRFVSTTLGSVLGVVAMQPCTVQAYVDAPRALMDYEGVGLR